MKIKILIITIISLLIIPNVKVWCKDQKKNDKRQKPNSGSPCSVIELDDPWDNDLQREIKEKINKSSNPNPEKKSISELDDPWDNDLQRKIKEKINKSSNPNPEKKSISELDDPWDNDKKGKDKNIKNPTNSGQ
jgi:hypothetical protein